ncbi:MAG TPA: hypothetical protein VMU57_21710 [Edaphobacter sp.]|uniref:hypothetical protein n=1 Tax=Edaphobacter sp. TaxID=1934404 RepID=UPI002C73FCEF|nr:hypothetical protein [Edaphobacter sp.]HUZ97530.1 hypothetical protein [Edaphobacter sp.]
MGYSVYYRGKIEIVPPLTEEHAEIVLAFSKYERAEKTASIFEAVAASAEPDLPGHAGLFELSEGRDLIVPDESESRHGLRLWLVLLIEHFLGPLGYVLNGEVSWTADDLDDRGCIFVMGNAVECVDDFIINQGPSWSPEHYSDDRLKAIIQELIDSADSTGCSPDLTVVGSKAVDSLREALSRL